MSSYLEQKIKPITNPGRLLRNLQKQLRSDLNRLSTDGNLRVCSNPDKNWKTNDGGCLLPNRTKLVRNNEHLSCTLKNSEKSEVVLGRAIFNSGELNGYDLLTYEAPFFRKGNETQNKDEEEKTETSKSGPVKCDLVGIKDKEFCCIELKTNPKNEDTQLAYALLEAFSYWVCAKWIYEKRRPDLRKEIKHANSKRFHGPIDDVVINKVTFAVAVPDKYVHDYKAEDLLLVQMLEDIIKKTWPDSFAGYWVLSTGKLGNPVKRTKKTKDTYIPELTGELTAITYKTVCEFLK